MKEDKLIFFIDNILNNHNIYFYTIDYIFHKIIIFSWNFILEVSLNDRWWYVKKADYLYFYIRKFDDIDKIYRYINDDSDIFTNNKISQIINTIIKYEKVIYKFLYSSSKEFFSETFSNINTNRKILFVLKWWWMEETIEKSFISFCAYNNLELIVLYRFGKWYWWQQLNQDWFFNELKANYPKVNFIYKEDFDDNYIDNLIDDDTEVFSFQYDYKWKHKNLNMIVLSSVTDDEIDCKKYKNIFSCYNSNSIWYSTDKFINTEKTNVYKIFNPQNINLINNYKIVEKINKFILTWWMSWCRDFNILNSLNWKYRWVIISDETHKVKNFISMYRWIQSYYWFFGAFKLSQIWVFCHLEEFNDDDRSKMIATSICAWKPVIIPYNQWLIVKDILDNKLWVAYKNWDWKDLLEKIRFFTENEENIINYSKNCLNYSKKNMDINKFMNTIFTKSF